MDVPHGTGQDAPMTTLLAPRASPRGTTVVRRAWLVLITAFMVFVLVLTSVGTSAYLYRRGAMQEREGWLETSGEVLVQPKNETRFKQVRDGEPLREGDTVKTPGGIQARLHFFDGSALALAEGSQVQITELRASRFVAAEKRIHLTQRQGWSRLMAPPTTDYRVGRFIVRLEGMEIVSERQHGQELDLGFELRSTIWRAGESEPSGPTAATVAVRAGEALVVAGSDQMLARAGERVTWTRGERTLVATSLMGEYARNGAFRALEPRPDRDIWPISWQETSDQGGDGGDLWGETRVDYELRDGQLMPTIVFERRLGAKDNAVHGIGQRLDLPLTYFQELRLRVTLRVTYHSLAGGGVANSEYPIIVKLTYRDRQNRSIAWYRGFYLHNEAGFNTPNGIKIRPGEWTPFEQDLLDLGLKPGDPEPVFLETLDIYASGHDFDAAVAAVSIEGY
jgi:hypothetical protein